MPASEHRGLLFIGDPHLEGRQPGFRKDDYPNVILDKLAWCLRYAEVHHLLPILLGDLFDKPRDNPNWMVAKLLDMWTTPLHGIYGNHDCADPVLKDHDTLSLLVKAGRIVLLTEEKVWSGIINRRPIIVGGSSYRLPIPKKYDADLMPLFGKPLVVWITHHDLLFPGWEDFANVKLREIPGVDIVVNGHIHRRLAEVKLGQTLWINPGNIARRSRTDATREHVPSMLRLDIKGDEVSRQYIEVPHKPYEEVFHPAITSSAPSLERSAFVTGLAELLTRRTESGAGLMAFLTKNLDTFEPAVTEEIWALAKEVAEHGEREDG